MIDYDDCTYSVDATRDDGRLGHLINHSKYNANVSTILCEIGDQPHLCFVAAKAIQPEEELLYDYNERRKMAIEANPWLTL